MNVFAFHDGPVSDQCCIIVGDKRGLIRQLNATAEIPFTERILLANTITTI